MWPFRTEPPEVDLTEEAYARWLRAQRPPWAWFLGQPSEVQETLAKLGDEYSADLAIALGYAVKDPEVAEAGLDAADNLEAEEVLARRVAADLVGKLLKGRKGGAGGAQVAPSGPATTMGGLGERRSEADLERRKARDAGRRLFGREPDGGDGAEETR